MAFTPRPVSNAPLSNNPDIPAAQKTISSMSYQGVILADESGNEFNAANPVPVSASGGIPVTPWVKIVEQSFDTSVAIAAGVNGGDVNPSVSAIADSTLFPFTDVSPYQSIMVIGQSTDAATDTNPTGWELSVNWDANGVTGVGNPSTFISTWSVGYANSPETLSEGESIVRRAFKVYEKYLRVQAYNPATYGTISRIRVTVLGCYDSVTEGGRVIIDGASPFATMGVDVTGNSVGLATSANQTNSSQVAKIKDSAGVSITQTTGQPATSSTALVVKQTGLNFLDFDTSGGTDTKAAIGILIPKSGGSVAGGGTVDPFNVTAASLPLPTGASTEATLALIKAKTDNIDVALSTRTKPADQQHVIVDSATLGTVTVAGSVTSTPAAATTTASAPTFATMGVASGVVIAANASRKGLILTNTSANTISLHMAAGTAVLNSGLTLFPGQSFVMDDRSFTTAAINGIASAASSNMGAQEFV